MDEHQDDDDVDNNNDDIDVGDKLQNVGSSCKCCQPRRISLPTIVFGLCCDHAVDGPKGEAEALTALALKMLPTLCPRPINSPTALVY